MILERSLIITAFHVSFQRFVYYFPIKLDDDERWFESSLVVLCEINKNTWEAWRSNASIDFFNRRWIGWWRMNMSLGDVEFADEWILMLWLPRCHFIQWLVLFRTIYEGTLETKQSILTFYSKQLYTPTECQLNLNTHVISNAKYMVSIKIIWCAKV